MTRSKDIERFWSKVQPAAADQCWEWQAARIVGYGTFWVGGRQLPAHRYAYESLIGPIPDGLHLDHLCRNPSCVNPWHVEPVPIKVNVLRGNGITAQNAAKTECRRGHPFDERNTSYSRRGFRRCRACMRDDAREKRWARRD